jgi:hypothetical protein
VRLPAIRFLQVHNATIDPSALRLAAQQLPIQPPNTARLKTINYDTFEK